LETDKKKYILKERPHYTFFHEYRILNFLREKKFPYVPFLYGIANFQGKKFIVQEYLEGEELGGNHTLFYSNIHKIAKIFGKLHSITRRKRAKYIYFLNREMGRLNDCFKMVNISYNRLSNNNFDNYFNIIDKYRKLLSVLIDKYSRFLDGSFSPSLVNRETEFIITPRGKIYLLDWEYTEFGDCAIDIASQAYIFNRIDLSRFLDVYKQHKTVCDNIYIRILIYLIIILIEEALYYISDLDCCVLYRKIPPSVVRIMSRTVLDRSMRRIHDVCGKLNSLKYP